MDSDARELLASAAERSGLSARAYHRVLKVARTIADLDDATAVAWPHVAEALRYRPLETREADARSAPKATHQAPVMDTGGQRVGAATDDVAARQVT